MEEGRDNTGLVITTTERKVQNINHVPRGEMRDLFNASQLTRQASK